jgi:hypothetical protein
MFANEPLKAFTNICASSRRNTDLRGAVPPGDYPTKEARSESLAEVDFNEILINVYKPVDAKLSGVHP